MKTILVPLDGSPLAEDALPHGLALARRYRAELVLLSVSEAESHAMQVYLERLQVQWASPDVCVRVVAATGEASEEILRYAAREPASMIVMRSHGRHGLSRLWLGSVTDRVIRRASCPVLVVPGEAERPMVYRRILVPLDGGARCEQALNPAIFLAETDDATLTLLQVAYPPAPLPRSGTDWAPGSSDQVLADARRYLEHQAALLKDLEFTVQVVTRLGSPAEEILEVAKESDLVVLTSHSRPWLERFLLGSVASRVTHHAPCSVLLVPGDARAQAH